MFVHKYENYVAKINDRLNNFNLLVQLLSNGCVCW